MGLPIALHQLLLHPRFIDAIIRTGEVSAAVVEAARHTDQVASALGLRECIVAHWRDLLDCLLPLHRPAMLAWMVQHVHTTQPPRRHLVATLLQQPEAVVLKTAAATRLQGCFRAQRAQRQAATLRAASLAIAAARGAARAARGAAYVAQRAASTARVLDAQRQLQRRQEEAAAARAATAAYCDGVSRAARAAEHALARARKVAVGVSREAARAAVAAAKTAEMAVAQARKQRARQNWQRWQLKLTVVRAWLHRGACQVRAREQEDRDREALRASLTAQLREQKEARPVRWWQQLGLRLRDKVELERWTSENYTHPLLLIRALTEQRRGNPLSTYRRATATFSPDCAQPKLEWSPPETATETVQRLPFVPAWLVDLRICQSRGNQTVRFACSFGWWHLQRFVSKFVRVHYVEHLASHPEGSVPTYRIGGLWPPMELRIGYSHTRYCGTVMARDGLYCRIHFDIGNKDRVHQARIQTQHLQPGDRVEAPYHNWTHTGSRMYRQQLSDSIAPEALQQFSRKPNIARQLQAAGGTSAPKKKSGKKKKRR
jgi:hypothetical protein